MATKIQLIMEHQLIFKKNTRRTHNRDNAIQLFSFVFSLRISSEIWRLGFLQKVFKGFFSRVSLYWPVVVLHCLFMELELRSHLNVVFGQRVIILMRGVLEGVYRW